MKCLCAVKWGKHKVIHHIFIVRIVCTIFTRLFLPLWLEYTGKTTNIKVLVITNKKETIYNFDDACGENHLLINPTILRFFFGFLLCCCTVFPFFSLSNLPRLYSLHQICYKPTTYGIADVRHYQNNITASVIDHGIQNVMLWWGGGGRAKNL